MPNPEKLGRDLNKACFSGNLEEVKRLVNAGAEVNFKHINETTPLYNAVWRGHVSIVKFLISKGANLNATNFGIKQPALFKACANGSFELVKILVEAGADINIKDSEGTTPLYAVFGGDVSQIIPYLISKGADANELIGQPGYSALHNACRQGYLNVVKALVDAGADINKKTTNVFTPLYIASEAYHSEIVNYLILKGANINEVNGSKHDTALHSACSTGFFGIVKILVDSGADVNKKNADGVTPLCMASYKDSKANIVKYLLDNGANVDERNTSLEKTALQYACSNGAVANVKILVDVGADINLKMKDGFTTLYNAIEGNNADIVKYIIDKGANANERYGPQNAPPVIRASFVGNVKVMDILLDAGADLNVKDDLGYGPLFRCVEKDNPAMVDYLVAKGVNINERFGRYELTALYNASSLGMLQSVNRLINTGANINIKSNTGFSSLSVASQNNHLSIVQALLLNGANVNELNANNWTALHSACSKGHLSVVKLLIDYGADTELKTTSGNKAIDIAILNNHKEVVNFLESLKTKPDAFKWKGFSRSDIAKFDTIFDMSGANPQANNIAVCPVCLKYVERSDACMYMKHNCATQGGYYHPILYTQYKDSTGYIGWCTICGRICVGHNHYKLGSFMADKPTVIVNMHDPFSNDCRDANGGGGLPEKFARFRRMRTVALELQASVGEMSEEAALRKLIEETWDAPLHPSAAVTNIMRNRKWNISTNMFPRNLAPQAAQTAAENYNNPAAYEPPIVRTPGTNDYQGNMITLDDTEPIIQFKHKKADGTMNAEHGQITVSSLIHYLDNAGAVKGKCFDDACGGVLWPKEIEIALANPALTVSDEQKARVAIYKERFNTWHSEGAVGGRRRTRRQRSA